MDIVPNTHEIKKETDWLVEKKIKSKKRNAIALVVGF
jgi:hypothetical protein